MADIWIGTSFNVSAHRVLILGESTYGEDPPLVDYIPQWIRKEVRDSTFTRLFNSFSGKHSSSAGVADREAFWAGVSFYNFVTAPVGPTRKHRPTVAGYRAAEGPLVQLLQQHRPEGVIILGIEQSEYSAPVMKRLDIPSVTTRHPTAYGVTTQSLTDGWTALTEKIMARR